MKDGRRFANPAVRWRRFAPGESQVRSPAGEPGIQPREEQGGPGGAALPDCRTPRRHSPGCHI